MGGIGVFFPGTTGFATEENSGSTRRRCGKRASPISPRSLSYMAFVAVGGSKAVGVPLQRSGQRRAGAAGVHPPVRPDRPGRHHPQHLRQRRLGGAQPRAQTWRKDSARAIPTTARTLPVDMHRRHAAPGQGVPYGWLVTPHDGTGLTAADVEAIVARGIAEADPGACPDSAPFNVPTKMVFAVSDLNGNILGLYRMPDATYFSIGVAVAKARNVAYYDNPAAAPADRQDQGRRSRHGVHGPHLPLSFPCRSSPRASTSTRQARARSSPMAA